MRKAILRPFKFVIKKARAWKNNTVTGRFIAKRCARYKRKSKAFASRLLQLDNGAVAVHAAASVSVAGNEGRLCTDSTPCADALDTAANDDSASPNRMESQSVLKAIQFFANPGPGFEKPSLIDSRCLSPRIRAVAFFLPQFHHFEENNEWWGEGFTEWRNVARGAPRFEGHYQPRIPRDLGFYDLSSVHTLRAQSEMASKFGIEAFCFYYYWFNGQRLMHKPLDLFMEDDKIQQEFCIMWANENWTRTWDGHDSEVLIKQDYCDTDEEDFIADTARYMAHERYMRVNGRPLFILYRPGLLPNPVETLRRWRSLWKETLGVVPWVLMVQGFGENDPRDFGLDGAVEFPPHKVSLSVPDLNNELNLFDPEFGGHVRRYEEIIDSSLGEVTPDYPLIKTVSPHWDNDARREGRGMVLHGSTPALYEKWLNGAIEHAELNPFHDESLVFVNAWNEWAESAYLEPDVHYGHAYLNATQRAVHGLSNLLRDKSAGSGAVSDGQIGKNSILLVGHDAHKHGAQMLLLSLATIFREQFGMNVTVLLKEGGELLKNYRDIAPTHVLRDLTDEQLSSLLLRGGFEVAICNTCVTGDVVPVLKEFGIRVVSLIHEMPILIEEFSLQKNVELIDLLSDHVVFPSDIVRRGFSQYTRKHVGEQHIKPQGTYKQIVFDQTTRSRIRQELGLKPGDKLVLNVGYADLRKGFDTFLQTAQRWMSKRDDVHFAWVGAISLDMERWVKADLEQSEYASRIHIIGFTSAVSDFYSASDVLFLTSREDPYPTVVLEAMNVGLPTVLFRGATGFDAVMKQHGYVVERGSQAAVEVALNSSLDKDTQERKQARVEFVESQCQLDDYCFSLLQLLRPELKKLSVVIPNYNYEKYLPERLASVFEQDMPVFEVIVLDDKSSDNSVEIVRQCARIARRKTRVVENQENSGNVFAQWKLGLSLSRGSHLWIAEADDQASASFLSSSLAAFKNNTRLSFTDSQQIDAKGELLAKSYNYYYSLVEPTLFADSFLMDGREFVQEALSVRNVILNVSSVVWDREHLSRSLGIVEDELLELSLVGDWRLYLACLDADDSTVAYLSEPLNVHRRHATSVTQALDLQHHFDEIRAMHRCALEITDNAIARARQMDYEVELRKQFKLPDVALKQA